MCIIEKKEVKLQEQDYLVYLKEVPTRTCGDGETQSTVIRAFVKKKDGGEVRGRTNAQTNHQLEKQSPD